MIEINNDDTPLMIVHKLVSAEAVYALDNLEKLFGGSDADTPGYRKESRFSLSELQEIVDYLQVYISHQKEPQDE